MRTAPEYHKPVVEINIPASSAAGMSFAIGSNITGIINPGQSYQLTLDAATDVENPLRISTTLGGSAQIDSIMNWPLTLHGNCSKNGFFHDRFSKKQVKNSLTD